MSFHLNIVKSQSETPENQCSKEELQTFDQTFRQQTFGKSLTRRVFFQSNRRKNQSCTNRVQIQTGFNTKRSHLSSFNFVLALFERIPE